MLKDTLRWAAQEVGYLARHEHRKGLVLTLKIRFRPFETHTRSRTLKEPTANDIEIFRTAWALVQAESWADRPVRLIGVGISGWDEAHLGVQQDLFFDSLPLTCPNRGADMRINAFVTDTAPIERFLTDIGEPPRPPPVTPARGPPAWEDAPQPMPDWDLLGQPEPHFEFDRRIAR